MLQKGNMKLLAWTSQMEYEEMDTEEEESEVKKLTEEELDMFHQYKEFYMIQGRAKGRIPGFRYIHRFKVKERLSGSTI